MGFQKHSQYVQLFNHHIQDMKEKGIFNQIVEKYQSPQQSCPNYSGTPIGFESCFTAFLVLLCGLGISLCIGIVELINKHVLQRDPSPIVVPTPIGVLPPKRVATPIPLWGGSSINL
jgi:hypothetical protein